MENSLEEIVSNEPTWTSLLNNNRLEYNELYIDEGLRNYAANVQDYIKAGKVHNWLSYLRSNNLPIMSTEDIKDEKIRETVESIFGRVTLEDIRWYIREVNDVLRTKDYNKYAGIDKILNDPAIENWKEVWYNAAENLGFNPEEVEKHKLAYQLALLERNHRHLQLMGIQISGSFVDNIVYKPKKEMSLLQKIEPSLKKVAAVVAASMVVGGAIAAITSQNISPVSQSYDGVRATDLEALQNWTTYVFHMDPNNQTQMNFTEVVFGLKSDPNVIFNGTFAPYLHNQTVATYLSQLVNNYTYINDNSTGGGHWLVKEIAAGAINGTMLPTALKIYALHPELLHDMDYLFMLAQTRNFQDGINATDAQILANEVAAYMNLTIEEKRALMFFPVNATVYTMTPGDLEYKLFSYYANQWGIDPSNVTQAKILLAYTGVFDGYYAIKPVANGANETLFLNNYILQQAPDIGINYLKFLATLRSGVIGLTYAINPIPYSYVFGIYLNSQNVDALQGAQYEKAFIWLNQTPRGYPNAYADARAFWNANGLNATVKQYVGYTSSVGGKIANPIDSLFDWINNRLSNGSTADDPGPKSFNELYMKYYINLTTGTKMLVDCSGISPLVWYLTISQPYLFVRYNNTLTNNSNDLNIMGPFKVENVQVYDHMGSYAIGWNASANDLALGNSLRVMNQLKYNQYLYTSKLPTYPRYMERDKTPNSDRIYFNWPGYVYKPWYDRPYIKMITNSTPISPLLKEAIGAMIDNDYNSIYGWAKTDPYSKYLLTGSQFPPIYRDRPVDGNVTGIPQVGTTVPELKAMVLAVPTAVIAFGRKLRRIFKKRRNHRKVKH